MGFIVAILIALITNSTKIGADGTGGFTTNTTTQSAKIGADGTGGKIGADGTGGKIGADGTGG